MSRVIALSGWKNSGKDSVAGYLSSQHGFIQRSFASRLKDMVARTYQINRRDMDDPTRKEMPLTQYPVIPTDPNTQILQHLLDQEFRNGCWTPRALLILEGSVKRSVYSNYWVRSVVEEVLGNPNRDYVISDLRFQSEADTLRLLIPTVQLVRVDRFEFAPETQDPSERDLDDYSFHLRLQNKGSLEDLHAEIHNKLPSLPQRMETGRAGDGSVIYFGPV